MSNLSLSVSGKARSWLTGLAVAVAFFAFPAYAESPAAVIQSAATELGDKLGTRKEELRADREALYSLINDILLPRFDRDYAAQLVLGRHWRDASDAQRERFIDAFYRTLLHRYADGVLEFNQDQIEVQPHRGSDDDKRTTVKTIVRLDDGTRVPVNYALVNRDGKWLMFDVTIEGISYVRNFRAELHSEVQAKGLEAVIGRLESEANANANT